MKKKITDRMINAKEDRRQENKGRRVQTIRCSYHFRRREQAERFRKKMRIDRKKDEAQEYDENTKNGKKQKTREKQKYI